MTLPGIDVAVTRTFGERQALAVGDLAANDVGLCVGGWNGQHNSQQSDSARNRPRTIAKGRGSDCM